MEIKLLQTKKKQIDDLLEKYNLKYRRLLELQKTLNVINELITRREELNDKNIIIMIDELNIKMLFNILNACLTKINASSSDKELKLTVKKRKHLISFEGYYIDGRMIQTEDDKCFVDFDDDNAKQKYFDVNENAETFEIKNDLKYVVCDNSKVRLDETKNNVMIQNLQLSDMNSQFSEPELIEKLNDKYGLEIGVDEKGYTFWKMYVSKYVFLLRYTYITKYNDEPNMS